MPEAWLRLSAQRSRGSILWLCGLKGSRRCSVSVYVQYSRQLGCQFLVMVLLLAVGLDASAALEPNATAAGVRPGLELAVEIGTWVVCAGTRRGARSSAGSGCSRKCKSAGCFRWLGRGSRSRRATSIGVRVVGYMMPGTASRRSWLTRCRAASPHELMGHSEIGMTVNVYTHVVQKSKRDAIKIIDRLLRLEGLR